VQRLLQRGLHFQKEENAMRRQLSAVAFACAGFLVLCQVPSAAEEAASFATIVPSNVHFFGDWRATPEREKLMRPIFRAVKDLADSGIGRDIFDLATMELPQDKREEALALAHRVIELLKTPRWGQLLKKECSFSFKMTLPMPEYLLLFRVSSETADERRAEFRKVFSGFAEFAAGRLAVNDSSRLGAEISKLEVTGTPIGVTVASKGDVLALSTSDPFLDGVLGLMDSPDAAGSIAKDPRFAAGLEGLGEGKDSKAFFDFSSYIAFLQGVLNFASAGAPEKSDAAGGLSIARTVIEEIAKIGLISSTERTEGDRLVQESKISFTAKDGTPGFVEALARDQKPIEGFARVVPKDAVAFFMTSGVNPTTIYDALIGLLRERLPSGPRALEHWDRIQEKVGFNLREDLLSWLDGGIGVISLPGRGRGPMVEHVLVVRLRDAEKARRVLKSWYDCIKTHLEQRGQGIDLVEVKDMEDFREFRLAAFPRMRPVIGLPGDNLVIACSEGALKRVAATFRGEAPNFTENRAFAALKVPEGPLSTVYYERMENSLQGLADIVAAAGFVASILPENHDTRPALKLGAILTKLGTFLRAVDLAVDRGGWARYDAEKHAIFSTDMARIGRPKK
jgi:hypothetical protein